MATPSTFDVRDRIVAAECRLAIGTFVQKGAGPVVGQTAEEGARALTFAATNPDMEGQ